MGLMAFRNQIASVVIHRFVEISGQNTNESAEVVSTAGRYRYNWNILQNEPFFIFVIVR